MKVQIKGFSVVGIVTVLNVLKNHVEIVWFKSWYYYFLEFEMINVGIDMKLKLSTF